MSAMAGHSEAAGTRRNAGLDPAKQDELCRDKEETQMMLK